MELSHRPSSAQPIGPMKKLQTENPFKVHNKIGIGLATSPNGLRYTTQNGSLTNRKRPLSVNAVSTKMRGLPDWT